MTPFAHWPYMHVGYLVTAFLAGALFFFLILGLCYLSAAASEAEEILARSREADAERLNGG
jgi:hypothetical protein